jgi:hypothetical protein
MERVMPGIVTSDLKTAKPVLVWCLPALISFAIFCVSFPIDRTIPFWAHLNLAEIFALWFLFITPIAVVISIVKFVKYVKAEKRTRMSKFLLLAAITLSVLVNVFVLLGQAAAFFF